MPMNSLLAEAHFDPQMTATLASAFDLAWERLKTSGNPLAADEIASVTRDRLARRILATARAGEGDHDRLVDDALSYLAHQNQSRSLPADRQKPA